MKDYNEMAQAVFERRDEFVSRRKKRRAMLLKAGVPLCSVILVALLGITFWQSRLPEIPTAPTKPTVNTENTDNIQNTDYLQSTDSTEPIESVPGNTIGEEDNTQYAPIQTDATSSSDLTIDDVPACSPGDKPQTNTVPGNADAWVPESPMPTDFPQDPTEVPANPDKPTEPQESMPTEPTMSGEWFPKPTEETESTDPTEPTVTPTGPLTINVGGKQCVAQVGDMVTYTAELYVKDYFETFSAGVLYGSELEVIEVVNPKEDDPAPVHFPNLTGGSEMLNYHRSRSYNKDHIFVTAVRLAGYRFREQKVLFTFDFVVKKPGETQITLNIEELIAKGGKPEYFKGSKQLIFENINIEEYLTVTPAAEAVIPTAPKEEEPEGTAPPFTYPKESFDGEAQIVCDGRTYCADVGQRVTYTVELEAAEKFDTVQLMIKYDDGLEVYVPNETEDVAAEDIATPNLRGSSIINYNAKYTENGQTIPAVRMNAVTQRNFDFRRRKVLIQVDFIIAKPGEYSIDLVMEEMCNALYKYYFIRGEQVIFDGIEFYEYVVVN